MYKKILLSTLAGAVTAFFLGWVVFGLLLMDFYTSNTTVYEGLLKGSPNMFTISLGCVLQAFLVSWVYAGFSGRKSVAGGAMTGAILGLLVSAMSDLNFFGSYNLYTPTLLAADVVVNGIYAAGVGAVIGFVLRDKTS
jgi:hypothetical protein